MLIFFLSILVFILLVINVTGSFLSGPRYSGPITDHFNGQRFLNLGGQQAKGPVDALKWLFTRHRGKWKRTKELPYGAKPAARVENGIHITFVNHSTFLIQVDGLNILTDPIWSERASPFSFVGPQRMRPPGIRFEDLPVIDFVLISHNHYDHLDIPTLKNIFKKYSPGIIAPLGVKEFLEKKGIPVIRDLDWWQEYTLQDATKVQATPAQHFSSRGTYDRDATLWCGYMIKSKEGNIYFVGDTGYNETIFKKIGEQFAPVRVAIIPIGAYKPQWFMSPIHCTPQEAVTIHLDLKSQQSIAAHFGTFALADDGETEPVDDLRHALKELAISPDTFIVMKEGEGKLF